jgi:hypothetical protein
VGAEEKCCDQLCMTGPVCVCVCVPAYTVAPAGASSQEDMQALMHELLILRQVGPLRPLTPLDIELGANFHA